MSSRAIRSTLAVLGAAAVVSAASADVVTLQVELDTPTDGGYQLTGQSAMFVVQDSSLTTGGQLDGVMSGGTTITYDEVFPPPSLGDYLFFGYFGRIETLDGSGNVIDTSMIVALQPGVGIGELIEDLFGGPDEAALVAALGTFDSQEFFDMVSAAEHNSFSRGVVDVPPIGRPGETLDLVAFIGGPGGDLGVKVGTFSLSVVPAPATVGLLVGCLAMPRRRSRC